MMKARRMAGFSVLRAGMSFFHVRDVAGMEDRFFRIGKVPAGCRRNRADVDFSVWPQHFCRYEIRNAEDGLCNIGRDLPAKGGIAG